MAKKKLKLTDERTYFRPFNYPWAFDAFKQSEQMHWLAAEVPMVEDVKDWKKNLTDKEKQFLTHIFRFFTQADIDVAGGYVKNYLPHFPQPEVRMMLCSFAAREAVHVQAYSHLIETL
jgi:ribonucleoside-diphosphate reductase beta chain